MMHDLLLWALLVYLAVNKSWANGMDANLTVLKRTVEKGLQVPGNGSGEALNLKRNTRSVERFSDVFDGTSLKWVEFQESIPEGAVSIWNSYAKRMEYPCSENNCEAGFYSPDRGAFCFYPYKGQEHKSDKFWLLVNENDFESLKWKGGFLGSIPSNSINTCPGVKVYLAKNKYGLGKVAGPVKAFFIGIDGWEYLYLRYDVLTVNKDYLSQSIYDVKYMMENGTYKRESVTLASSQVTNNNWKVVKKTATLSRTVTSEHRWDFSISLKLAVSTTLTAKIIEGLSLGWTPSAETTISWSQGFTQRQSVTHSLTVEVEVPPNHECEVAMEAVKMTADVPFTATATRRYRNGEKRSAKVRGVSKNIDVAHVKVQVTSCKPIPTAHPTSCQRCTNDPERLGLNHDEDSE
nr:PREDICTED: natterin-3-like [Anolis carolinensis]|eukprot:XP_016851300.1 PREDICTED: natterin-3-like [Anolis carolinensis]